MLEALFIGGGGGFLHGLFYSFFGDAAWLTTLILSTVLGLLGGALMSSTYKSGGGLSPRNLASVFLMGFIPKTIYLYVIGSDNMPFIFGLEAGVYTIVFAFLWKLR